MMSLWEVKRERIVGMRVVLSRGDVRRWSLCFVLYLLSFGVGEMMFSGMCEDGGTFDGVGGDVVLLGGRTDGWCGWFILATVNAN